MMRRPSFILSAFAALGGSAGGLLLIYGDWMPFAWAFGGLVGLAHALAASFLNRRAVRSDFTRFLLIGLGANLLRAASLVLIIALADRRHWPEAGPLIFCVLFSYAVFLVYEILSLHFLSLALIIPGSFRARTS
jgi:hypothetical protein